MLDILVSGLNQGLIWALLALGVYVSYRLLDVADLSCEGTITLGASVGAFLIYKNVNPFLAILVAFIAGMLAGALTGVLTTKLKIPPILSGILTMTALYSVNIHIMSLATGEAGTSNLALSTSKFSTVFGQLNGLLHLGKQPVALLFGFVFLAAVIGLLFWFFGTELGCTIRATGNNAAMCRAQGVNTDFTKILGLALSNGLIALCGTMLSQYQGYVDVNMGIGSIVIGLASIIIGEALFSFASEFIFKLLGIVVGAVLYRVIVALVIFSGMPSTDLKLMTAVVVVVALCLTNFRRPMVAFFKKLFRKGGASHG